MISDVFMRVVYIRVMILAAAVLGAASLIASGALFAHQRWLTYAAGAGVLWEVQWLLLTLLDRTLASSFSSTMVFSAGSLALLAVWLPLLRRWQTPRFVFRREGAVLAVLLAVLAAAWLVMRVNGFQG